MAEAARARAAPLHPGLPDEIFIWEILLRLPHKPLLRCRAVCRAWRRATSTREFLLAHHGRQPSLPLLLERHRTDDGGGYLHIMSLDHRAGVAAADQLHSVARLGTGGAFTVMEASCDGLIILCTYEGATCISDVAYYSVCNPATRQYAPLPQLCGFCVAGMYRHHPTGEYRLLLYPDAHDEPEPSAGYDCYVYALGSCEPPRDIGWPAAEEAIHYIRSVLFRGRLHWFIKKDESQSCMVTVFDTTAELFRQMRAPAVPGIAELFEMDEMLCIASFYNGETPIDIWMTQDYDSEVWAFKYRVELPVAELTARFGLTLLPSEPAAFRPAYLEIEFQTNSLSWWLRLGMMVVGTFWSNVASGYFRLAWMANWLPVSVVDYFVLQNLVSNKVLSRMPSFRKLRVML